MQVKYVSYVLLIRKDLVNAQHLHGMVWALAAYRNITVYQTTCYISWTSRNLYGTIISSKHFICFNFLTACCKARYQQLAYKDSSLPALSPFPKYHHSNNHFIFLILIQSRQPHIYPHLSGMNLPTR